MRNKIQKGAEFANYRVIEFSTDTYQRHFGARSRATVYRYVMCRCTECGSLHKFKQHYLYDAHSRKQRYCCNCITSHVEHLRPRESTKVCPVCCDLGERRSATTPCKGCSKLFEREIIYREECMINRSPIALAQGMI